MNSLNTLGIIFFIAYIVAFDLLGAMALVVEIGDWKERRGE